MRYSETHKQETRERVLKAAATAVRTKGPEGVAVAEIMAKAGLTHGGFYAHFPSKDALVAAAIAEAFMQLCRRFARLTAGKSGPEALAIFVDDYVSNGHRLHPERGCPITALSSQLPRQPAEIRKVFDAGVKELVRRVADWLPEGDEAERLDRAASLVSEMAGAVTLSRAISDDKLAERLLADARRRIKARMGLPDTN